MNADRLLARVQSLVYESELEIVHKESLRNVYLFGSRVHGTNQPGADYDVISIVEGPYFEGPKLIEKGDLNVNLYHRLYFSHLLRECLVWCLLVLFLPRQFVLKEEIKLEWQLRKPNVRKSALLDAKHNLQKAKRCWREGDFYKAKKNILHGIRYLQFGVQLLQKGVIYDIQTANELWSEVMSETNTEWTYYENKYKPIYERLTETINSLAKPIQLTRKGPKNKVKVKNQQGRNEEEPGCLLTFEYIRAFGMEALTRELGITVTAHQRHPNLFHLCADKLDSPEKDPVVAECAYGLILERTDDAELRVVGMPYTKFYSHYRLEALPVINRLDWHSATVTEKVDGVMASLYNYQGQWYVSSCETPEGSEQLISAVTNEGKRYYYSRRPGYNPWKFFEAKLEWAYANEKFDDDRVNGYFPNQVASVLDSPSVRQETTTFADLFWSIWRQKGYRLPQHGGQMQSATPQVKYEDYAYMFCVSSSRLALILAHRNSGEHPLAEEREAGERLVLHGVRHRGTLKEEYNIDEFASVFGCEAPRRIASPSGGQFENLDEVVKFSLDLDPLTCSGFVVVDRHFNRVKVKSPAHRALDKLCWSSDDEERANTLMLEIVRTNPCTSFLEVFPQWRGLYDSVGMEWQEFCNHVESLYGAINWPVHSDQHQKGSTSGTGAATSTMDECVKEAKKSGLISPVLFKMWHRGAKASEVLRDYPQHLLLRMLKAWRKRKQASREDD